MTKSDRAREVMASIDDTPPFPLEIWAVYRKHVGWMYYHGADSFGDERGPRVWYTLRGFKAMLTRVFGSATGQNVGVANLATHDTWDLDEFRESHKTIKKKRSN